MSSLLLYCRPGFESECASEIRELAADVAADTRYEPRCGYVIFKPQDPDRASQLHAQLDFTTLVFCRQWFVIAAYQKDLPRGDRVSALIAGIHDAAQSVSDVFIEAPDSEAGKPLLRLCRGLQAPLRQGLVQAGILTEQEDSGLRLHICFFTTDYAAVGYARINNSAPWPMGIPRLRRLREAPSRSALKLEEALLVLLNPEERQQLLQPGMQAVDLGAAPGGWSWVMARQGVSVAAIDNGPLSPAAMHTGLIEHIRADGFRYRPSRPVDWLLCDMVEQPSRIAELIGLWFVRGLCRHAIFNLKLPMKKRYTEYRQCINTISNMLAQTGLNYSLRARQLYHDRDEITLYIRTR
ncbi:MAG: 23S rRNA (cytidine(2498)-2'-O)-methyltransferase RlmM [Gammaproteobacteria bacterium]|jgi:23S rRNA (cytidine2498-2'-O)-methyltransferase